MSDPDITSIENDLSIVGRPGQQEPPAAFGTQPILYAIVPHGLTNHLMLLLLNPSHDNHLSTARSAEDAACPRRSPSYYPVLRPSNRQTSLLKNVHVRLNRARS
jgi:hypothetical protein